MAELARLLRAAHEGPGEVAADLERLCDTVTAGLLPPSTPPPTTRPSSSPASTALTDDDMASSAAPETASGRAGPLPHPRAASAPGAWTT